MLLHEITQMKSVDQHDPSGLSGAMSVDPDKVDAMLDPNGDRYSAAEEANKADRSKRMKRKWQMRRERNTVPTTGHVVDDNTDLTGSSNNSATNGGQRY